MSNKNRTLNEYRQTKDSVYNDDNTIVERDINLLCRIYPNNYELGKIIRKYFQKL
tara:strand:+ start:364 stop:528 length:165 start_codon:yes stop_codon:yes gene_type:complete